MDAMKGAGGSAVNCTAQYKGAPCDRQAGPYKGLCTRCYGNRKRQIQRDKGIKPQVRAPRFPYAMRCPCGGELAQVYIYSLGSVVVRLRKCETCKKMRTTAEVLLSQRILRSMAETRLNAISESPPEGTVSLAGALDAVVGVTTPTG